MNAFKAGAYKVNITPPVGVYLSGYGGQSLKPSHAINDELFAKALVMSDGKTQVAIVTTDLLGVPPDFAFKVKSLVHEQIGMPPNHFLISASHTHYGPLINHSSIVFDHPIRKAIGEVADKEWLDVTARKIAGGVLMAHEQMREAKVGAGKGVVEGIAYNRRTIGPDGKVMRLSYPREKTEIKFGPVDNEVCTLKVEDEEGRLIAVLINFACHPVCDRASYSVSADYPAHAMKLIEQVEGGVCLFALGCAGNINPIMTGDEGKCKTGRALGAEALKLLQLIETKGSMKIETKQKSVELPLKPALPLERAQEEAEEARDKVFRLRTEGASEKEVVEASMDFRRATHTLVKAERFAGDTVPVDIQLIRVGDIGLVGLPGEVFVEIGLSIKHLSPLSQTFVISLANNELNYVPTTEAYEWGKYEPDYTFIGPGADKIIIEAVKHLLRA